jgi:hypothetical protein
MNSETWGINEMDKNRKKKSGRRKVKRPTFRNRLVNGGMLGGASYRPKPPLIVPRRDLRYNNEQKRIPKQEKSHWNGKVEIWTEPQKSRQQKIVKYEVDTDKLLRELAKGNKDALNEITERIEKEMKSEPAEETEPQKKTDTAEKTTDEFDENEVSEKNETETAKQTNENSERAETDMQNEESTEKSENETEANEDTEAEPQQENTNHESQEISQDIESETESSQQEDPLDAPELVYMNPSFWDQLESEMSDELEQLEPEEDFEIPPEESEPIEEGY